MTHRELHPSTVAIHAGLGPDAASGAVAQPIVLSTTFRHPATDADPSGSYLYGRADNPNRRSLEAALAALEGGAVAMAFSSGNAATHAVLHSLPPGSTVLHHRDLYSGSRRAMQDVWKGRLNFVEADLRDLDAIAGLMKAQSIALVWIETPTNPMLEVLDVAALSTLAHEHGALAVVDNTWATPMLQQPLALGADVVVHSTSKYMSGHSDMIGGALVVREEGALATTLRSIQVLGGGVPSPFDCWLARRGIMTLPVRMRTHVENATRISHWLRDQPGIAQVLYPGFGGPTEAALVARQMRSPGAMLSFRLSGGEKAAAHFPDRLQLIGNATSLGGVESLLEWRAPSEGPDSTTPRDLIRFSVGLEDAADLEADLAQALRSV